MAGNVPANGANPLAESKSAKKRKAKAEAAAAAAGNTTAERAASTLDQAQAADAAGEEVATDTPYMKELSKNIRNTHKKLGASAKADAVVAENPGVSLDELVANKKLNNDQKAQVLKKPQLEKQLTDLQEQLKQYRQFGKDYEERFGKEKAALLTSHQADLEKAKEEAGAAALADISAKRDQDLLLLSQFLHAAAAKRQTEEADSPSGQAFEALLFLVYQGNETSLNAFQNLIDGSSEKVNSTEGDLLELSYADVKQLSIEAAPMTVPFEEVSGEPDVAPQIADPTIAHAGLTEQNEPNIVQPISSASADPFVDGASDEVTAQIVEQSAVGQDGNAVAEHGWAPETSTTTVGEDEWVNVNVQRDPKETDTGIEATPAATAPTTNTNGENSWAEEVQETAAAHETAQDGFATVTHQHRGRGRGGRGAAPGQRSRGDGYRGRGRGDGERRPGASGRGRGRGEGGGYRGDRRGRGNRGDRGGA